MSLIVHDLCLLFLQQLQNVQFINKWQISAYFLAGLMCKQIPAHNSVCNQTIW